MNPSFLLTLKIGNSTSAFGVFDLPGAKTRRGISEAAAPQARFAWRAESRADKTADEYAALLLTLMQEARVEPAQVSAAAMVSVVPPLTETMREVCLKSFGIEPFLAAVGVKSGIRIKYEDPRALGADRLVALVAAKARYGVPCILIDLGTATTFNALDARGNFVGGAIAPGLNMAADALHQFTAKLPRIQISAPPTALATNTHDAMRSGILLGFAGMVEGMVARFKRELNEPDAQVIATGGMAALLAAECSVIQYVNPDLALDGLYRLYEMNRA